MKDSKDVYGHLVYDYFNGIDAYEIVERDDGFISISKNAPGVYFEEYKNWPSHHKEAMKYIKGRVLDVGCGAGRHLAFFKEKGFDYLGIDISSLALKVCKERGIEDVKNMSIGRIDSKIGKFDTIILLGNNFGLLRTFEKAKTRLKKFYSITNQKAHILIESNNYSMINDPLHKEYLEFNKKRGRMSGQLRIRLRYKKYATDWFDYLQVSKEELREIIKNTGWDIKKLINSKDTRYIVVLQKS